MVPEKVEKVGLIRSERTQGRSFDLYEDEVVDFFVDGMSDGFIGPFVSKLSFFVTERVFTETNDGGTTIPVEVRRHKVRITIPTASILEMVSHISVAFEMNKEELVKNGNEILGRLQSLSGNSEKK